MRKRAFTDVVWLVAAIGCGESAIAPPDAATEIDAGQDGGLVEEDAGPAYPLDHGCAPPCVIHWREMPPLDQVIDHHTTFVLERDDGPYLYVLGGVRADALGTGLVSYSPRLQAARILPDGTLGAWEAEDFGIGIGFHAQAQRIDPAGADELVWIGGVLIDPAVDPPRPAASPYAYVAAFAPGSGSGIAGMSILEAVRPRRARLSQAVLHGQAAWRGDHLFLVGGSHGTTLGTEVLRHDAAADAWVADAPLPGPRSHHAMVVIGDRLVVLGGFSGSSTSPVGEPSILASTHDAAGHVIGWEEIGTLDEPPWTASAFVRNGFVYLVGGGISGGHHGDGEFLARVRRAPIGADGRVGAWQDVNGLPIPRSHVHQTPVYGNRIYSVGGRIASGSGLDATDRVFVGTFED
jgi:hypothetical protein